jgi:excisionase family DNA binding protein
MASTARTSAFDLAGRSNTHVGDFSFPNPLNPKPPTRSATKGQWLTAREAAVVVRMHPVTLLRWAREGKVPHRRLSARKILFPLSQLTAWLETGSYTDPVGHAAQPERTVA